MKKNLLLTTLLALFSMPALSLAQSPQRCVSASEQDVASLFDKWNDSLATGDATKVSELYVSDSVLLPALSHRTRLTDQERIDYFNDFLKKEPRGKINVRTIKIGCNQATDKGVYTFTFKDGSHVKARYLFNYVWDGGSWKIAAHRSAALPEKSRH